MALVALPRPTQEKPRVITASASRVEDRFEEFEVEQVLETTDLTDVAETDPSAIVAEVENVQVVTADDALDAAPLAVDVGDVGSIPVPFGDMVSQIGGGAAMGFGGRSNAAALAAKNGGGGDTEAAVDRALDWFMEHQLEDGSWSFDFSECPKCRGECRHSGKSGDRAGATAMALLPFLGRGQTHQEGRHRKAIERGIAFLAARSVQQGGVIYEPRSTHGLYIQGLAGIALSECYGLTQDRRLAGPAQLALNHIMAAQDPRGGGWRYRPGQPGDTSASGWQIMALKSGDMAYLQVNPLTVKKAVEFLDSVQSHDGATYGYTDNSRDRPSLSAVGLLCRMYVGWKKDHPVIQDGAKRLAWVGPTNDLYYDYYATQVMHHLGGDLWKAWNARMKTMLLQSQARKGHEKGSWLEGVNGGPHAVSYGGRLYCTSLATMILEVYYRHLPIYRTESVDDEFRE
ncbi:MAG: prenyltransferase/squalene oxidase repeat-containing protein [Planctomycetaceae bacterium]